MLASTFKSSPVRLGNEVVPGLRVTRVHKVTLTQGETG